MPKILRVALGVIAGFIGLNVVTGITSVMFALVHPPHSGTSTGVDYALSIVAGVLAAVVGGCLAALVARDVEVICGSVLGGLILLFGLRSLAQHRGSQPLAYQIVVVAGMPLVVVAAAWLTARSTPRRLINL